MEESYIEGLTSRNGPESGAGGREATGGANDRGTHRRSIEPRKRDNRVPTLSKEMEGNTDMRDKVSA